jgi:hypothetical protein
VSSKGNFGVLSTSTVSPRELPALKGFFASAADADGIHFAVESQGRRVYVVDAQEPASVCLLAIESSKEASRSGFPRSAGATCARIADVADHGALVLATSEADGEEIVVGLVPDEVARVELEDGPNDGVAPVNNVFVVRRPAGAPGRLTLVSPTGRRTISLDAGPASLG